MPVPVVREYSMVSCLVATEGPGNSSSRMSAPAGAWARTARAISSTGATAAWSAPVSRKRASMTGGSCGLPPEMCTELVVSGRIG
jgi:hypothetical protein